MDNQSSASEQRVQELTPWHVHMADAVTDTEKALRRANRALRALSECNQILVRAADETELLNEICRTVVERGGYRLAWVGWAENDEARRVRPVAQNGYEAGYLQTLDITWADTERGRGPTGTAIRTGKPYVAQNILTEPSYAPWRENARRRGYASAIALPLRQAGESFGALNIYATEPDAFDVEEVGLLSELADDLAYGLMTLRARVEKQNAEAARHQAEEKFRHLFEHAVEGIFQSTPEGRLLSVNPALAQIYGYASPEEMMVCVSDVGRQIYVDPASRTVLTQALMECGTVSGFEAQEWRKDGAKIWTSTNARVVCDAQGQTLYFEGFVTDITAQKRVASEIEQRAEQFEALYEIARDLAHPRDMETLLHTIADRAVLLLGANGGGIYLYDAGRRDLEIRVAKGSGIRVGTRLQLGEGMAGRVAETRQPMIVDDYHTWGPRAVPYEGIPITGVVEVPMLYGGELIGVLAVHEAGSATRKFTEADVQLLSLLASQAASAVYNARLLEEATRRAAHQTALNTIITAAAEPNVNMDAFLNLALDCALQALGLEMGALWVLRAANTARHMAVRNMPAHFGELSLKLYADSPFDFTRTVLISGDPAHSHPGARLLSQFGLQTLVGTPLYASRNRIGGLGVATPSPRVWSAEEIAFIESVGRQIGTAAERMHLFEEMQQRLSELEVVNKISTALRVAPSADEMLPRLLDEALVMLHADTGAVWLYHPNHGDLHREVARGWLGQIQNTSAKRDEGIVGHVFGSGQAHVSRELVRDPYVRESVRVQGLPGWGGVGVPIRAAEEIAGVLMVSVPLPREINAEEVHLLTTLAEIAGNALHRMRLHQSLQDAYETTLEGWSHALDLRDKETEGHTQRVTELTTRLAQAIGMDETALVHVRRGALLHDIGKMGIPDSILLKPGALTADEWVIMRMHPAYAYEWLSPIEHLRPALDVPYCHHEKWDGTGYPRGLKGAEIPLAARIFAVIDVWDALRSDRPYRPAWRVQDVRNYILANAGTHFDPAIVTAFLKMVMPAGEAE